MAKLIWDIEAERQYETGTDKGVLYTKETVNGVTDDNKDDYIWQGSVWNGLTAVTESPSGAEANDLWADNMKYATIRSAEQFGFTIEAYGSPVKFAACDGSTSLADFVGVRLGQQKREKFGFCFRSDYGTAEDDMIDTEENYKLHLIWGCSASPSERSYSTINDSPEAITFSWECTATQQKVNTTGFKPLCSMIIEKNSANEARVALLEEYLYGTETTFPRLPSVDTVLGIMSGTITAHPSNTP